MLSKILKTKLKNKQLFLKIQLLLIKSNNQSIEVIKYHFGKAAKPCFAN